MKLKRVSIFRSHGTSIQLWFSLEGVVWFWGRSELFTTPPYGSTSGSSLSASFPARRARWSFPIYYCVSWSGLYAWIFRYTILSVFRWSLLNLVSFLLTVAEDSKVCLFLLGRNLRIWSIQSSNPMSRILSTSSITNILRLSQSKY